MLAKNIQKKQNKTKKQGNKTIIGKLLLQKAQIPANNLPSLVELIDILSNYLFLSF